MSEQCGQGADVADGQTEGGDLRQPSTLIVSRSWHNASQSVEGVVQLVCTSTLSLCRRLIPSSSHLLHAGMVRRRPTRFYRCSTLTSLLTALAVGGRCTQVICCCWWWCRQRPRIHLKGIALQWRSPTCNEVVALQCTTYRSIIDWFFATNYNQLTTCISLQFVNATLWRPSTNENNITRPMTSLYVQGCIVRKCWSVSVILYFKLILIIGLSVLAKNAVKNNKSVFCIINHKLNDSSEWKFHSSRTKRCSNNYRESAAVSATVKFPLSRGGAAL